MIDSGKQDVAKTASLTQDPFALMSRFARRKDRSSPLAFIGRESEIKAVKDAIESVAEDGTPGLTTIIHGLPGAGKTSLLAECARRFDGGKVGSGRVWFAPIRAENLAQSPQGLCASICESLRRKKKHPKLANLFQTTMSMLSDHVTGRGYYEQHNASHGLGGTVGYADCFSAYADSGMWGKDNVIVLLADETQLLADFQSDIKNIISALDALHNCDPGVRLLLVCAGLQNTPDVLLRYKLSRKAADSAHMIGTLSSGEGREVLSQTMDKLGLRLENSHWCGHLGKSKRHLQAWDAFRESLIDELERDCADFPQHLTAGLMAVCSVFDERKDDFGAEHDDEIVVDIKAKLAEHKENYYEDCLGGNLQLHKTALGAIVQAAQEEGAISRNRATKTIQAAANRGFNDDEDALAFVDAKSVLDGALQRGILRSGAKVKGVMNADKVLPSAIPSMNSYLTGHFDFELGKRDHAAEAAARSLGSVAQDAEIALSEKEESVHKQ